jgi:serine/threonine protein kinase
MAICDPGHKVEFAEEDITKLRNCLKEHQYLMGECLGSGGFSMVFKVHSVRRGCDYAAKITDVSAPSRRKIGDNEQLALMRLNHRNIIRLYDHFFEEDYQFLILEQSSTSSLRTLIRNAGDEEIPNMWGLFAQICEAVAYVHSHKLAHRDIKPANILMDHNGRPKLADFGLCIPVEDGQRRNDLVGSPQYCAPELLQREMYDPKQADIWALGVTLREMACGRIEWTGTREDIIQSIITDGIPIERGTAPAVMKLIRAMTHPNPRQRPTMEKILAVEEVQKARPSGVQKTDVDSSFEKRHVLRFPEWAAASHTIPGLGSHRTGRRVVGATKSAGFDASMLTFADAIEQDFEITCNT